MNFTLLGRAVPAGDAPGHINKAEILLKPRASACRTQGASRATAPQGFITDIS